MKTLTRSLVMIIWTSVAAAGAVVAQDGHRNQQQHEVVIESNPSAGQQQRMQLQIDDGGRLATFSPRLGARFQVQRLYLPAFGEFTAARIVSVPEFGSPLRQLGLEQGDIITRLDGVPVTVERELERHILDTTVRFVKAGTETVRQATIFIHPNRRFVDPLAGFDPGAGADPLALRP